MIALRQSPCGIPNVVVRVCPFALLFFTCSVTSFKGIFIMLNSSGSRISDKSLYKCSVLEAVIKTESQRLTMTSFKIMNQVTVF